MSDTENIIIEQPILIDVPRKRGRPFGSKTKVYTVSTAKRGRPYAGGCKTSSEYYQQEKHNHDVSCEVCGVKTNKYALPLHLLTKKHLKYIATH